MDPGSTTKVSQFTIEKKGLVALGYCGKCKTSIPECKCWGDKTTVNKRAPLQSVELEFGLEKFKVEFYIWEMNEDMAKSMVQTMIEDNVDKELRNEHYSLEISEVV